MSETKHGEGPGRRDPLAQLVARYRGEWERLSEGQPEPNISAYLMQCPAADRPSLRAQLESIAQQYRARMSTSTAPGNAGTKWGDGSETVQHVSADPPKAAIPFRSARDVSPTIASDSGSPRPESPQANTIAWSADKGIDTASSGNPSGDSLPGLSDYQLIGELGRGGMGVVYKACQKSVNRTVALKMMLAGGFASPEQVRRFQVEAEAVASLDHPNIVPIFHVGESNGLPYFTMKYIEGMGLDKEIRKKFRNPRAASLLICKISRAIDYAHRRGILHRDLKPANILIDAQGEPHITDFGLAKRLGEDEGATRTGAVMGTPDYMSPEQAAGETRKVSVASDVYSIGSILFDLLTGEPPFRSQTLMETLIRVTNEPVRAPRLLNRAIDPDLETICMKCLEKDPEQRYTSALELADELECYLAGKPIAARRIGRIERTWRWCKRNPVVAGLMAAVVVLVIAWLAGLHAAIGRISEEKEVAVQSRNAANVARDRALRNEAFAVQTLNDVIGTFHDGLRDQPGLSDLRDKLLFTAAEKLKNFRNQSDGPLSDLDPADVLRRTNIALNQRFGDVLFASGKVTEALPYYQAMETLVKQLHDGAPNDPKSKQFMAACANKLADAFAGLGQLRRAREFYRSGLDYREQWVTLLEKKQHNLLKAGEHGDSQALNETKWDLINAKWDVSVSYLLISGIDLLMGDLDAARSQLEESHSWAAAVPEDADFRSAKDFLEMSLRFERMGDVHWRMDDVGTANAQYQKAIGLLQRGLQQQNVTKFRIRRQLARCYLSQGDVYLRILGDTGLAKNYFQDARNSCEELVAQAADDVESKALLADALYKLGIVSLREKDLPQSSALFRRCLEMRQELARNAPPGNLVQAELMMALARCGQHEQALAMAEAVKQHLDQPAASYFAGRCYSVCAGLRSSSRDHGQPPSAPMEELEMEGLAAMGQAIQHGWNDWRSLETDPDLEHLDLSPLLQGIP